MVGNCKLCNSIEELKLSHVIPASIYRWLKKTSGTDKLRNLSNINRPLQDGRKHYWLCGNCELKFSSYEKYFIEEIFKPVNNNELKSFKYDNRFFYFLNSLWWRIIVEQISDKEVQESIFLEEITKCESELRRFLNTYEYPMNYDKNYTMLSGKVSGAPRDLRNLNYFFLRTVDPLLYFNNQSCFISLRLPSFYFFLNIKGLNNKLLKENSISPAGGELISSPILEPQITELISQRIYTLNKKVKDISLNQKEKINKNHRKNMEKFKKSKSYDAWINDKIRENE